MAKTKSVTPVKIYNGLTDETLKGKLDELAPALAHALQESAHNLAGVWGEYVHHILGLASERDNWGLLFVESDDQVQGALAYHDVLQNGAPYSKVLVQTILDNGGDWSTSSASVSSAADHELVEMLCDPACNLSATNYGVKNNDEWAREVADPVQNDAYLASNGIALSDWVTPDFFNPWSPRGTATDYMNLLTRPFAIRPGGYAIINGQAIFGRDMPEWQRAQKMIEGKRTKLRVDMFEVGPLPSLDTLTQG